MVEDAKFEDGNETPLRMQALDQDDLKIIATLTQDAVFPITEMSWQPSKRRFALLINRFRWENGAHTDKQSFVERVQAMLVVNDVTKVASNGLDRRETDLILSLLDVTFTPGEDTTGRIELTLAGDGAIALEVECLDVTLSDVTRPYAAPSKAVPKHSTES